MVKKSSELLSNKLKRDFIAQVKAVLPTGVPYYGTGVPTTASEMTADGRKLPYVVGRWSKPSRISGTTTYAGSRTSAQRQNIHLLVVADDDDAANTIADRLIVNLVGLSADGRSDVEQSESAGDFDVTDAQGSVKGFITDVAFTYDVYGYEVASN